jgi:DNA-binding MarR family transcriptional regulator/GNAT superfamily N-acetyltransferase
VATDDAAVGAVRSFNRTVTRRMGVLSDHYLGCERPLGEARVLWEIGEAGSDVRVLRRRLGLDSGYLSRLLRSLESAELVKLAVGAKDKRVRTARLTKRGRAELRALGRRSDALARSVLSPLSPAQQQRLVTAMAEVERLLTAATVEIGEVDPDCTHARRCLAAYYRELDDRFTAGFDPTVGEAVEPNEMRPPAGLFLLATLQDRPAGCGVLRFHDDGSTEIKRLWVDSQLRGLGVGRRLLDELEARAVSHGSRSVCLDTNQSLDEAIAMYRRAGYREVAAFNNNPYADYWFEKHLDRPNK